MSISLTLVSQFITTLMLAASPKPLDIRPFSPTFVALRHQGTPPRFDSPTAEMAPTTTYNCIISPFDKYWDLSQKADQERWLVASKAVSDHVRFDVSVATADQFLELLKDKNEYFRWGLLMHVSIAGNGSLDDTKDKLVNGEETMKVTITEKVNLLTQWTKGLTTKCQQFAQWYNGDDNVLLTDAFQVDPASRKVFALELQR